VSGRLARIPLRLRLTLVFVAVTSLVLVALGVFLHARLRSELDASLRRGLRQRAADLVLLARQGAPGLGRSRLVERGDDLAQVLDRSGAVVAGAPGLERRPLLAPADVRRARAGTIVVRREVVRDEGEQEAVELLAAPAGRRVVVVGAALEERDDALASLDRVLLVGVPGAVVLAGLLGFVLADGALRPLHRLRRRADTIGATDLAGRLPVPAADDEVRALAETLNAMLARLQAGFERERAFVADAGHELRTPLANLKAELELAARPGREPGELRDAVASAAEETERLVRLAEDLLTIARSDQGRIPLRADALDVAEVLRAVAARARPPEGRPVTVVPADGLRAHADRLRLEQALANLVDNALRHGAGRVELSAHAVPGAVELHVRDEGGGFHDDFADRAFDRFTRADAARGDGGAGLGLAIVAVIARAHGGSAGIVRAAGGADVWVRLPR
jgi:two-component system OmpR family sensor kinase